MKLLNASGKEIKMGDMVSSMGEVATVMAIYPPPSSDRSGKILVKWATSGEGVYYVAVFGLHFE